MEKKKRLFLASSAEVKEDRKEFEILIGRKNKDWVRKGVFLELIVWEDFLDTVSRTRLQDDYNKAIRECDIFIMLFFTKVGKYTEEEFETAFGQFKATNKPFIFTYFKDAPVSIGSVDENDLMSLLAFKKKLAALGHFYTAYKNTEGLLLHFSQQLDKLVANGFIEFKPEKGGGDIYQATLTGNGAIAQGPNSTAVGAGGVAIGGNNTGSINTGTQANTGGGAFFGGNVSAGGHVVGRDMTVHGDQMTTGDISGTGIAIGRGAQANVTQGISPRDLESLFAPLLAAVAREAPPDAKAAAVQHVQELKAEMAKGKQADVGKVDKLVDGLLGLVPKAVSAVVSTFASPILGGIAGPVTKYVLEKLEGN